MTDAATRLSAALADRYRIERELGAGGMATVYLAEDLKHHRKVAIKVLRPELAAALGPERFMQEIEIAARLQHPHILSVFDSGQAEGILYYVMPYVEGESLRDRLARGGELPVHEAVRLLGEIADALGHAHARGVVHRDIKPENVMLSGRHALVVDFGVAKAVNEASGRNKLTTLGVALGTPAYMAPEQASADPHLDHRVDIYALGVVGYELLAGRPPFAGASPQQVLAAHVTQAPAPVSEHRPALSPALNSIIMKALEKRPADRWQSAEELLAQLEPLATPSGGMTPTSTTPVRAVGPISGAGRRLPGWALAALGLGLVAAAGYGVIRAFGGAGGAGGLHSVAVLPFESVGGDSGSMGFADGIQSEILTDLTRLASLQVTSRSSVQEYRNSTKSVKQIGTELGVRTLLQGQVQRAGDQVHVTVQLVDASRDRQIWAESYDRQLTAQNIFAIQGDIAQKVAEALRASFTAAEVATVQRPPTENIEALEWYYRGRALFQARAGVSAVDTASIQAFVHATTLDPQFGEAWAGLAAAHSWQLRQGATTDTLPARTALDRAVALAPASPETEIARGFYTYYALGDLQAALTHFKAVAAVRPNDADAVAGVGYVARRRRRWAEALEAEAKVITLNPRDAAALADHGFTYLATRQYAQAEELFRRGRIADPANEASSTWLFTSLLARGDTAAARALVAALPAGFPDRARIYMSIYLERLARHFEASNTVSARMPVGRQVDTVYFPVYRALNDLAAGAVGRARLRADSAAKLARTYLASTRESDVFGNRADFYSLLGVAEAIQGQSSEAVRNGERAVALNPPDRDAMEAPRSTSALVVIHLILGHREEAIRLITSAAHETVEPRSLVSITRGSIRLDPVFDGIRNDPRIQALLKDDSAWVVR